MMAHEPLNASYQPATLALDDEDRLPWLEAVDEEIVDRPVTPMRMIVWALAALAALGMAIAAYVMWQQHRAAAAPDLIRAPTTPYKVPPRDDAAMQVPGEGDATFNTSQGMEPRGRIDLTRGPESPAVAGMAGTDTAGAMAPAGQTAPGGAGQVAAVSTVGTGPATASSATTASADSTGPALDGPGILQLGAFESGAVANDAWRIMIARHRELAGRPHSVTTAVVGGGTVYRLRAQVGSGAAGLCTRLKASGQNCMVVR